MVPIHHHPSEHAATADDSFMGALEAAERELKATGGASSSTSAQTSSTDTAGGVGVSNSLPPDDDAVNEPYAASDDEPSVPPTAAVSAGRGEGEGGGGRDRHRGGAHTESRSTFKARVIKEVKMALRGFYSAGRITSKEDFKELAREVAHKVLSKDPKKTTWDSKMPGRVQKYVDGLFARNFIYDSSRRKAVK
eukprot:CAMPEP_0119065248 /NCGR_PEP_ID=MMETSP1178-20130426/8110_1 /TAXON_ID=33656 /ORGANISM="unid sp, Strain CCMP2000" /LENGTH=192 /DNA_ID=CAMNT_0007046749 /DNA_START=48 /DNA_END=626 /DNA_ORIENTATION=+